MSDPHRNDYCVVCGNTPEVNGPSMHPVADIPNGCVCNRCVQATATKSDGDRCVILGEREVQ